MKFELVNDKMIVAFDTDLVASYVKEILKEVREKLEGEKYGELEVDIADVKVVDSLGINFLVGLYKVCSKNNHKFKVVGVSDTIKRLFTLYNLCGYFNVS